MHHLHAGRLGQVLSLAHWAVALRTGVLTGMLAVLLSFVPAVKRIYGLSFGNPLMAGLLTALGDVFSHRSHYRIPWLKHVLTGLTAGLLALAASYFLEDRGRRVRAAWARELR